MCACPVLMLSPSPSLPFLPAAPHALPLSYITESVTTCVCVRCARAVCPHAVMSAALAAGLLARLLCASLLCCLLPGCSRLLKIVLVL